MLANGSYAAPVIAGFIVGVAFIILFTFVVFDYRFPKTFPDPSYYSALIQVKVSGLEETYRVGEQINFFASHRAGGCVFPETILIMNKDTNQIVWQFNSTQGNLQLMGCINMASDPSQSRMGLKTQYEEPPIIANQPGLYAVIVQHQHVKVEQEFRVIE
jgi:hypothetical protein